MNVSPFAQNSYFSVLDPDEDQDEDFASFIERHASGRIPPLKATDQDESLRDNSQTSIDQAVHRKLQQPICLFTPRFPTPLMIT